MIDDLLERLEWISVLEPPALGRKIVALYNDGCGAVLLYRHDGGYIDGEGWEWDPDLSEKFSMWAYLPQHFTFFCEQRSEDPFTLPGPAALALQEQEGKDV